MTPRVSIVLPVHNAELTLAEAIESCLMQTMADFELLVMLDGCTDRSAALANGFDDARLRVFSVDDGPQGVARAANELMTRAVAPLIARMDADDRALPRRLEAQYKLLQGDETLHGVTGEVSLLDPLGDGMQRYVDWVNSLQQPEDVLRERFVECPLIQPSLMVRKSAFLAAGGYHAASWAEDHDLFLRMFESGMCFGKVDEPVLEWRDSATRLTRTHPAYAEDEVWKMKAHFLARLPEVQEKGVAICGAGPIGKRLAKLLLAEGVAVQGFFEVNPRRIGEQIGGVPVAGPDDFGTRWREAILLSAVGVDGGRERVRALARSAGYVEGSDFWCCC